jgi:2-keto-4-pentenoate hydratase
VDGKTVVEGTGALVLGHPFKSLVWLVNNAGRLGHTLSKGQVLTTGSMTGIYAVEQGAEAVGDFGRLGKVVARFG